ncbi:hypothetical protein D3C78_1763120 [compost metagenome]
MVCGDFDDIETELGDLLDIGAELGAPLMFPVRIIDAVFHGDLFRFSFRWI